MSEGVRGVAETIWDVAGQRACKLRMNRGIQGG